MDGASKFVRGDAIAGIIITAVNIVGGFVIGMLQHGMPHRRGARNLHPPHHRRRPGLADPRADHLDRGGHRRHPRRLRVGSEPGAHGAAHAPAPAAGRGRGDSRGPRRCSRACRSFRSSGPPGARPRRVPLPASGPPTPRSRHHGRAGAEPATPEKVEELLALDPLQVELGYGLLSLVDKKTEDGGDLSRGSARCAGSSPSSSASSSRRSAFATAGSSAPTIRLPPPRWRGGARRGAPRPAPRP